MPWHVRALQSLVFHRKLDRSENLYPSSTQRSNGALMCALGFRTVRLKPTQKRLDGFLRLLGMLIFFASTGNAFADDLIVCAASTLAQVLEDQVHHVGGEPKNRVLHQFDASGTLRAQIERGAPCDVFISADRSDMDALSDEGRLPEGANPVCIARNQIVLAVRNNATAMHTDAGALNEVLVSRIAIPSPDAAPAGRAARKFLQDLGRWDDLLPKIVFAHHAQGAAQWLRSGAVDAAFLLATDAKSDGFRIVTLQGRAILDSAILSYWAAPISIRRQTQAREYIASLQSSQALARFVQFGFLPPDDRVSTIDDLLVAGGNSDESDIAIGFPDPSATRTVALPEPVLTHQSVRSRPTGWFAPEDFSIILLSTKVSFAALIVCIAVGTPIGAWLARTRSPLRHWVEAAVLLPLVMPPVVVGIALLQVLSAFRSEWLFTPFAAAAAAAVVALPLYVRSARSSFSAVDPRLTLMAQSLGASRFRAWWMITLPLAGRGIIAGAFLCWARAFGEFGATIVVAGNLPGRTRTVPLAVWTRLQFPDAPSMTGLIILCIAIAAASVVLHEFLIRPKNL